MNKINLIAGLPRSGSTLLCAILQQNKSFHATQTSLLPHWFKKNTEVFSEGIYSRYNRVNLSPRILNGYEGFIKGFYKKEKIVFDKDRNWIKIFPLFKKIFPKAKLIFIYRNVEDVLASIIKQEFKREEYHNPPINNFLSKDGLINYWLQDDNIILSPLFYLKNCKDRGFLKDIIFIEYEELIEKPQKTMEKIHSFLQLPKTTYQFNNISFTNQENNDIDNLKFLHTVKKKLKRIDHKTYFDKEQKNFIKSKIEYFEKKLNLNV